MAKVYDNATDLITFARSSSGTALRRVGYGDELVVDGAGNWVGDFDTDTDWDLLRMDIDGGTLNFGSEWGANRATSTLNVVAGKTYSSTITCNAAGIGANLFIYVNGVLQEFFPTIPSDTTQAETIVFRATQSGPIELRATSTGAVNNSWDNFSVKEVIFDRPTDDLVLFNHPDDIPRIEYAADGSLKGLLIEEQRTNLVTYSEDFTQWNTFSGETSVTLSSDTIYGVSAYEVTGSTGGFGLGRLSPNGGASINLTSDGVLTFWAKKVTAGATLLYLWNGVVVSFDSQVPNDGQWHKVEITLAAANSQVQLLRGFTSGTVALAMPQLEQGSFPTSYIPTSGGQKTRDPDIASIPVSAFGYNQSAGTVVVEFDMLSDNAGPVNLTQAAFGFHDGTSNNRLELWSASTGTLTLRDRIAPVNYDATSSGNSLEHSTKSAASYASGEASKLVVNGGTAVVAGTATTPPAYSTLLLGDTQNVDAELNGHIKSLSYFPRRLTDAQLQELTS